MEEGIFVKVFDYDDLQTRALSQLGQVDTQIRLPNDRLGHTLNGPCRTYRLGRPMTIRELEAMPRDLQILYLRRLRRMGGCAESVGEMLGVLPARLSQWGVCFDRPDPKSWAAFLDHAGR
ncbi:MAG: hypothetical protein J6J43_06250 [Oscillospiraceae bacterium]|nr:hypothetical protein [Oscillospiraceae bacterium]